MKRIAPRPRMTINQPVINNSIEPQHLACEVTDEANVFVLAHAGIPEVDKATWSLEVCGMVGKLLRFTFNDLIHLPQREVTSIHRCAGNPFDPTTSSRQIANLTWGGVDVRAMLEEACVDPGATHLWSYGIESGEFFGHDVTHYVKDVPLSRVARGDVLIAHSLNGSPLSAEHGYPARLVIPGYYGTNHVKWICRLELADRRPEGLFTTRLYFDGPEGSEPKPVWHVDPDSMFVFPLPDTMMPNTQHRIWGRAWSGSGAVSVEVSTNGGDDWEPAEVSPREGYTWQTFSFEWQPPRPGAYRLMCRATDELGQTQPMTGWRNEIHSVDVTVGSE